MGVLNEAAIERAVKAQTDVLREVLVELRALRMAVGGSAPAAPDEPAKGRFGIRDVRAH